MGFVTVTVRWNDEFGECYDCGNPAAYCAPDIYGEGKPLTEHNLFCCICAAGHAHEGQRITWLWAEEGTDTFKPGDAEIIELYTQRDLA